LQLPISRIIYQVFIKSLLTSAIVARMELFLVISNYCEQVGFPLLLFALKQPSHFAALISTMS
jgi:hypothetical protein